jgi:hypothetical protein
MLRSGHMERAKQPPFLGGSAKASFLLAQHTKAGYRGLTAARKISGAARKIFATVGQASRWEAMSLFERGV